MNLRKIQETLVYFGENLHESQELSIFWGRFSKLNLCVYKIKMFFFKWSHVFDLGWSSSLSLEWNSVGQFRCDLHGTQSGSIIAVRLIPELDSLLPWSFPFFRE